MDFERKIFIKRALADHLARELARGSVKPGETIALGAATDPYQPAEKRFGATRTALKVLARHSGFRIGITTKSDLILRDLSLLKKIARRHRLHVRMTVTTTDPALARKTEPRAVTPRRRLQAVRRLVDAGVSAGINLMPILPGINDDEASIAGVFEAAAEARAVAVGTQVLFLTAAPRRRFDLFLAEHFPHLAPLYREYYRIGPNAPEFYRRRIERRVEAIRLRYGLGDFNGLKGGEPPLAGPSQPALFD
jgi:DNA repair photolyase